MTMRKAISRIVGPSSRLLLQDKLTGAEGARLRISSCLKYRGFIRNQHTFRNYPERENNCKAAKTPLKCNSGIRMVKHDDKLGMIYLQLNDIEEELTYPIVFLRDNCRCHLCRSFNMKPLIGLDFNADVTIKYFNVDDRGLFVTFDDGHSATFPPEFFASHRFPASKAEVKARKCYDKPRIFWDSSFQDKIPLKFPLLEVLSDEQVRYQWLETLVTHGIAVVSNAKKEPGEVEKLGQIMHGLRENPYGAVIALKSRKIPNSLAYTGNYLPLHSDLPYYRYQPGIVALHCIEQSREGGVNLLVDGFGLARKIRTNYPKHFDALTSVKFSYAIIGNDVHGDYHFELDRPIIQVDDYGEVNSICHNNGVQYSFINDTPTDVQRGYEAYYLLVQMMNDPEHIVEYKMAEGDILTFDNLRLLHGRTAYDPSEGDRYLVQSYFDWDQAFSVMRVLRKKFDNLGTKAIK